MLYEPTTLANVARLVGETLQKDYGIDPGPLFEQVKIDTSVFRRPGARVPLSKMTRLWDIAVYMTDDQQFGLKAGSRAEPGDFYVLGHTWLASGTLRGALERLSRYAHVLSTAIARSEVVEKDGMIVYVESFPDPGIVINRTADEAGMVAFFKLCEIIKREHVRPLRAELVFPADTARGYLEEFLGCPVTYGNEREKFYFRRAVPGIAGPEQGGHGSQAPAGADAALGKGRPGQRSQSPLQEHQHPAAPAERRRHELS
jgi:hypothetical protein